jgi:glycolate oxidase iron-sulfur subunit
MALLACLDRGTLVPSKKLEDRIFSCMLCGACASLCPREMDVTGAIYEARKKLFRHNIRRRFVSYGVRFALRRTSALFRWARALRGLGGLVPVQSLKLLRALNGLDISITSSPLREGSTIYRAPRAKGRVAVFAGCTVNYLYPDMGRALIGALNRAGYDVVLPKGEVCCGAPLLALGLEDDAALMMRKNVAVFQALHVQAVLSLCPTCVSFITGESERLIGSSVENSEEISRFLLRERSPEDRQSASPKFPAGTKVLYHDPCHTLYHLKARKEPREIIRSLGYTLVEPTNRGCCGFGGTFRAFYPEFSEDILRQRVEDYSVADMIVTSCPNCVLQFRARMKDKVVKHIIELL